MLDIYIDFRSPAAYLAFKPTMAMLLEVGVQANWHAFAVSEAQVPEAKSDETKGESHRRVRAQARRDTHLFYAGLQQSSMNFPAEIGDTELALRVLSELPDKPAFIEAAFAAYWVEGLDLNDEQVVAGLLEKAGFAQSLDGFILDEDAWQTLRDQAIEAGVFAVPTYLIRGQTFVGREHLPWIRELLSA